MKTTTLKIRRYRKTQINPEYREYDQPYIYSPQIGRHEIPENSNAGTVVYATELYRHCPPAPAGGETKIFISTEPSNHRVDTGIVIHESFLKIILR